MWRAKYGTHFGRNLIDLTVMKFPLGLGPEGLCQGSKSLSWNYFGYGSEKQSHVIDSGGKDNYFVSPHVFMRSRVMSSIQHN